MLGTNKRKNAPADDRARPQPVAAVGLAVGAAYLVWRSTTLSSALLLSLPVFLLELWAFLELVLFAIQAWRVPPSPARRRPRQIEPVEIAIVTSGKDLAELERTLISVRAVRARGHLVVIDDVTRIRHRQVAHNAGASYVVDGRARESPGSMAHRHTSGDRYLWLEAGQLPMPDLFEVTAPCFDRPEMAVCQVATSLLNADALAHLHRDRDDDLLLNRVLGPALSRWDAAPWPGAASIVRRRSIDDVGGFGPGMTTERLTARLHRAGCATSFEPRRLVATTAPETTTSYLALRRRRAKATFGLAFSREGLLAGRELRPAARLALLGTTIRHLSGVRQLLVAAATVMVLLTGSFPAQASAGALVPFWLASVAGGAAARRALARGAMGYGDWIRQGWRSLEADVGGLVSALSRTGGPAPAGDRSGDDPPAGLRALVALPLLDATAIGLDLALLARAATLLSPDLLPRFTGGQRILALGFALALLIPIVDLLQVVALRRQRRADNRIPAVLEATVDGTPATTFDVTPSGFGVLLPVAPPTGGSTQVHVALPGVDGMVRRIVGRAVVRSARPDGPDRWRVGLELTHLAPPAQQALTAFCATSHPAAEPDTTDDEPAMGPDRIRRRRRPLRTLTGAATAAGLTTLVFGPGVASATGVRPDEVQAVCLSTAAGDPTPAVAVERLADGDVQPLGTTNSTGCLAVGTDPGTTGFALVHRGARYELRPTDLHSPEVSITLLDRRVRIVDGDGQPVAQAQVRYFTDRWHVAPAGDGGDGARRFETLPIDTAIDVVVDGSRHVRPIGTETELTVVLGRARLDPSADPAAVEGIAIDRGRGWEAVADGMLIVPGRLVIRLGDGSILRVGLPEGHDLLLPAGDLLPLTVETPTVPEPDDQTGVTGEAGEP